MSKSLGNFYTLRDLVAKGYPPEAIRYLLASVPYRKSLNFTVDGLKAAIIAIERLRNFKLRLETDRFPEGSNEAMANRTSQASASFEAALADDLNTAEALAAVFEYIRDANTAMDAGEFRRGEVSSSLNFLQLFDSIFDVLRPTGKAGDLTDAEVETRITERAAAKKAKNFALADRIRDQLLQQGIILEDTKAGIRWKRK
jgi:cysteinyl-tRNA synthetase